MEGFLLLFDASSEAPGDLQLQASLTETMDNLDRVLRMRASLRAGDSVAG